MRMYYFVFFNFAQLAISFGPEIDSVVIFVMTHFILERYIKKI